MTAEEIKPKLGLRGKSNNTLNKYVLEGKLELKSLSRQIKLYRLKLTDEPKTENNTDLDFCF